MTKEQKIEKLEAAISSESTPENIKAEMRITLEELKKPEPPPVAHQEPAPKKKVSASKPKLAHEVFLKEHNLTVAELPTKLRFKINAIKMPLGKGQIETAKNMSENVIPFIEEFLKPAKPDPIKIIPKEISDEDFDARLEKLRKKKERLRDFKNETVS